MSLSNNGQRIPFKIHAVTYDGDLMVAVHCLPMGTLPSSASSGIGEAHESVMQRILTARRAENRGMADEVTTV
jgi:hypothetical protein